MVRHGCIFDSSGSGTCITGDCGGKLKCDGVGGAPPASLAEFTLDSQEGDFYDVSLVDGYNLPVSIFPTGGSRQCKAVTCRSDLNRNCPSRLEATSIARRSASQQAIQRCSRLLVLRLIAMPMMMQQALSLAKEQTT
ncbi:hypothetical protein JHK82_023615 [Glycine max]|nr:hypothetical protein JHK85_024173 [Glycine max]KAG5132427.1 hypothetical protein JHK82_023615 [Glycine max]